MMSLRKNALVGGLVSAAVSIAVVCAVLFAYIDRTTLNRFDKALLDRHTQLTVAVNNYIGNLDQLELALVDPAYSRAYSGRYWQIENADGRVYTSSSMFGSTLELPEIIGDGPQTWESVDPDGNQIRAMQQEVTLSDGTVWCLAVVEDLSELWAERNQTRQNLIFGFAFIGLLGIAGAMVQTTLALRPLTRLRDDILARWDAGEGLDPNAYPSEVAPIVGDINSLMERNHEILARARRQSADLAHALKTPSAILHNELSDLELGGVDTIAASDALERIDRQVRRSLARMRAANVSSSVGKLNDTGLSVARFSKIFTSMASRKDKNFEVFDELPSHLYARMEREDFEEILGNLLDNALKWCRSRLRLSAYATDGAAVVVIEDDGPGVPENERKEVLAPGRRLDTSAPGTGLGLAIVADLLAAYSAELSLMQSEDLGGLKIQVTVPTVERVTKHAAE
ncbi:MAG: sensor histidine kinase [Boseongicola sp.]